MHLFRTFCQSRFTIESTKWDGFDWKYDREIFTLFGLILLVLLLVLLVELLRLLLVLVVLLVVLLDALGIEAGCGIWKDGLLRPPLPLSLFIVDISAPILID